MFFSHLITLYCISTDIFLFTKISHWFLQGIRSTNIECTSETFKNIQTGNLIFQWLEKLFQFLLQTLVLKLRFRSLCIYIFRLLPAYKNCSYKLHWIFHYILTKHSLYDVLYEIFIFVTSIKNISRKKNIRLPRRIQQYVLIEEKNVYRRAYIMNSLMACSKAQSRSSWITACLNNI